MKVLLLGVGLQGNAALFDLEQSKDVEEIIAADIDLKSLKQLVDVKKYSKVSCEYLDATKTRCYS